MAELNPAMLRAFIHVAEELHFGRAASLLYVTAPALSQQISRLEKGLGVPLFDRSSRHVALTSAGEQLLPLARDAVAAVDRISTWSKRRTESSLRVGFMHAGPRTLTGEIVAAAVGRFPASNVTFRHVKRDEAPEALRSGEIDVAFLWGPHEFEGLESAILALEPQVVLMHASGDSERQTRNITFADLSGVPVLVPESNDPAYVQWCALEPRADGRSAVRGPRVQNLEEALAMVAAGHGFFVLPRCVAEGVSHVDVVANTLEGLAASPFSINVSQQGTPPLARDFFNLAVELASRAG